MNINENNKVFVPSASRQEHSSLQVSTNPRRLISGKDICLFIKKCLNLMYEQLHNNIIMNIFFSYY